MRKPKKRETRERLFQKQGSLCWICKEPMTLDKGGTKHGGPNFATIDHNVPKAEGGANVESNYRLAHRRCNSDRGDDTLTRANLRLRERLSRS